MLHVWKEYQRTYGICQGRDKMTEVKIPFNLWSQDKLLWQLKKATSRYKKYAEVGDEFKIQTKTYYINLVEKLPLWFIRNYLYESEGCKTPEEFVKIWIEIHPKRGFRMMDKVWYHHFTIDNRKG